MTPPNMKMPVEVELALQVMPCQAMRRTYDAETQPHACAHFSEWGSFHSFDYQAGGAPVQPGIVQPSVYAGKRPIAPEILSGCRKAPILAVGINPNLPGWSPSTRNAIHPYFDDYLQYAHYFRWRATNKLRIPKAQYEALKGDGSDDPFDNRPLAPKGTPIDVEHATVTMYTGYQSLLDDLAAKMGWEEHQLALGEDIAYANMVACGSARWTTRPVAGMPVMGQERERAIVKECFRERQYFLRQMLQTLPGVVMVFSQTTANAFISAMQGKFTKGAPQPQESINELIKREIRIKFGQTADGEVLDARVIFSPHISARPEDFEAQRAAIVDHLAAEVASGGLELNAATGRLRRKRGGCVFCKNALFSIGECAYADELRPLADPDSVGPLDDGTLPGEAERQAHEQLLGHFTGTLRTSDTVPVDVLDDGPSGAPPMILRGHVVPMDAAPIARGAVYLAGGMIVAVQDEDAQAPEGFDDVVPVDTDGVIYPGLADLHNHLIYNILSLWWPQAARVNRSQWLRDPEYKALVSMPMEVIAKRQDLLRAAIRYVEVKLLLGGVTSGQGMASKYHGNANYRGLMRNFEQSDDPNLPSIRHKIVDLQAKDIENFRAILDGGSRYFFHLAEGTNLNAKKQFDMLAENGLIASNLVGIHSLGLAPEDLATLAQFDASVVWSPMSNAILYGRTIAPRDLLDSKVKFALGSDWTPSGSRNILQEMKVAALAAEAANVDLSYEQIARAATVDSMDIAGWGHALGRLRAEGYADLLVLDKVNADVYRNLVEATERNIKLVIVEGIARHGDTALMQSISEDTDKLEAIVVGGRDKSLYLEQSSSPLNHISFAAARDALERALADLPAARDAAVFEPFDDGDLIEVELEMQTPEPEFGEIDVLADVELPQSVPLDAPTLVDDLAYWERLDSIEHLPVFLKGVKGLQRFYR